MQPSSAPLLFDRQRLRHNRQRAGAAYPQHRALFDAVTSGLYERVQDIKRPFKTILDLGSRDFSLARLLAKGDPARTIIHADLFLNHEKAPGISSLVMDEEWLPFSNSGFDLIIANMNLHTVNDLPGALIQMRRALKPDGLLLGAFIGGQSLHELRACLDDVELAQRGGLSPHLFPAIDVREAGMLLNRAGFALPVVDRDRFTLNYRDAFQLMHELRFMGEGNMLAARDKRYPGRGYFPAVAELYRQRFGDAEGRIPASFDVLFMAGWAPMRNEERGMRKGKF